MALTEFQFVALARLLARDLSRTPMKVDARSLGGLRRRGLVEYCGRTSDQTIDGRTRHTQAFMESTTCVTDAGRAVLAEDGKMGAEVRLHLRLERDRALDEATKLERRVVRLRIRAASWEDALNRVGV